MTYSIGTKFAVALLGATLAPFSSAGAAGPSDPPKGGERPARMEAVSGSSVKKITLTPKAAQRLDIQTGEVRQDGSGKTVVPYSALIYDKDGSTWVYTNPQALTYVRHAVTVDTIHAGGAVVKDGPAAGVKVVTIGVPQLYGAEKGVGH